MWTFQAMGTEVTVAAPRLAAAAEEALAGAVAALFADAERRFSRFRDDSEVSRLNRATTPIAVSPELLATLRAARRHVATTGGLFDPAVGAALEAAGYDRSFAPGALDRRRPPAPVPAARFDDLIVDETAGEVRRPPHLRLDLGGLVKGRTVDQAARLLPADGFVDAGGDAVLRGDALDDTGWSVDVEDPADPERVALTLRVHDRAVATSAPNRRRWRAGDATVHHLIDPRTARSARSDLAQVTVVAATAEDAEVLAKAAFLLGAEAGGRFLAARGVAGVLIGRDGAVHRVGDLEVLDD